MQIIGVTFSCSINRSPDSEYVYHSFRYRLYSTKSFKFLMAFQLKLLGFWVFLLLTLSFCHGKNVTVKVIGLIHCTDCIRHDFSSSQASLGINVFIRCKSGKSETKTQGKGDVDREGKFNVTLSAEITRDGYSINGCFAKLQSTSSSPAPCPIRSIQTASLKILSTDDNATRTTHDRPTLLKFSPVTCQSAFFWPKPNFTFFPTSPPPSELPPTDYAPPPSEALPTLPPVENLIPPPASVENLVPPPAPVENLVPPPAPVENLVPPPAPASSPLYLSPAPTFESPQQPPNPTFESPSPSPIPIYIAPPQIPPSNEPITPNFPKPIPPPFYKQLPKSPPHSKKSHPPTKAFYQTPSVPTPTPIISPIQPPQFKIPVAPTPFSQTPHPIGISTPPNQRKSNPIPRPPPVPQLPAIPPVPRKFFNPPKSKSEPPRSSYSFRT